MTYEQLDWIADSYIPILALLSLASIVAKFKHDKKALKNIGAISLLLFIHIILVYALMFLDSWLQIMTSVGLDYSTHSALSLVLAIFLIKHHSRFKVLISGSLISYALLMMYQEYHSLADILVTGLVVGIGVWLIDLYLFKQQSIDQH